MAFSIRKNLPLFLILLTGNLHGQEAAPGSPDTLFQSAMSQLQQGKYQDAEVSFRKLSEMEPGSSRGILGVAEVWGAQKKIDDAIGLLQAESAKYPARLELHYAIGNLALVAAKYDLAISEFQLVLERVDRNAKEASEVYLRMGEAYRLKGDVEFAINVFQKAQALQPSNLVIVNALAATLEMSGQRKSAAEQYRKMLELDPKNGVALNNLAFMLADTDGALALAYALRARQLFPNEPTVIDTLGWVYLKSNRIDDALPLFRDALKKNPGNAAYRYHLAAALEQKGAHAEARQEAETALKSNPSKDDAQKINELLRTLHQ